MEMTTARTAKMRTDHTNKQTMNKQTNIQGYIAIDIRMPTGKHMRTAAFTSDSIGWVKLMIKMQTGIPSRHQRLIFAGQQLENDKTVEFYDLKEDSTIQLVPQTNKQTKQKTSMQ